MRAVILVAVALLVATAGCGETGVGPEPRTHADTPTPTTDSTQSTPTTPQQTTRQPTTHQPTTPQTTTPPPATTDPGDTTNQFPVPPGAQPTYAPEPSPPVSASTRIQAYDVAGMDPVTVTEWYRTNLDDWEARTDVENWAAEWGWMNHLVYTKGDEILVVYVTSADTGTELTLARGTETVAIGRDLQFASLGWEPVTYTTPPVAPESVSDVVPLGNLAPPGHTFPTDHHYLFIPETERPAEVVAPADGIITKVVVRELGDPPHPDYSIVIRHSNVHVTEFQHMSGLDPGLVQALGGLGDGGLELGENVVAHPIEAGAPLGTAVAPGSTALDWFTYDYTREPLFFVHPEYYGRSVYTASFLEYASPAVQAAYEERLTRTKDPRYGRIDYDEPGTLAGNWFLETDPLQTNTREHHLAFVYSVHDPDDLRVSVGGIIGTAGMYAVEGNAPDPATVTPAAGPVTYHLRKAHGSGQTESTVTATILVEVIGENRIRVQGWNRTVTAPTFTEGAVTYVR